MGKVHTPHKQTHTQTHRHTDTHRHTHTHTCAYMHPFTPAYRPSIHRDAWKGKTNHCQWLQFEYLLLRRLQKPTSNSPPIGGRQTEAILSVSRLQVSTCLTCGEYCLGMGWSYLMSQFWLLRSNGNGKGQLQSPEQSIMCHVRTYVTVECNDLCCLAVMWRK